MKNKKTLILSAFVSLLAIAAIIGCTGTGGILFPGGGSQFPFVPAKFAIVFNGNGTGTLTSFTVSSSGALTAVTKGLATNVSNSQAFMDADPNTHSLFVPNGNSAGTVSVFTIGSDGSVTGPNGTDATTGGTFPISVALHPSGKFLYAANAGTDNISTFSVGANGALTAVGSPIAAGSEPHSIIMDWQGRFLYVTHVSTTCCSWNGTANDTVNAFSINSQTGALTSLGTAATGQTPRRGMVDYSGQYLILSSRGHENATDVGSVSVYRIQSDGSLAAVAGSPFKDPNCTSTSGCSPFTVAEAIVGGTAFIGTDDLDAHAISIFTFDTNSGNLTPVSGTPFLATGFFWPHYVAVDSSGQFGYVVDWGSSSGPFITQFNLSSSGTPSPVGTNFTDSSLSDPTQILFTH